MALTRVLELEFLSLMIFGKAGCLQRLQTEGPLIRRVKFCPGQRSVAGKEAQERRNAVSVMDKHTYVISISEDCHGPISRQRESSYEEMGYCSLKERVKPQDE